MKLLYLASVLLATAAMTYAQVVAAIAAIEFTIEIIAEELGQTALIQISNSFEIIAEVGAEEVTFTSETLMDGVGSISNEAFAPTDLSITDIDPVNLDVEDETIQANLRWNQNIQVFDETYPVQFVTGIAGDVTVTAQGEVTFAAEGEIAPHGAQITFNDPALQANIVDDSSSVTFNVP